METVQTDFNSIAILVADHVSAMLAYWDKNLVCRFANAAYVDWFGKTREEMVDKMTIKELLGPLYEKNLPYISGALEGKKQIFEREIPVPTGGIRYSIANYFPDIHKGEVQGFFVHVADITPVKLLEKELVRSNKIISEQNKRLLNFANIATHNLRNYAHGLQGFLDLLIEADSDEKKNELLEHIKTLSANFSQTIKNLNEIVSIQNLSETPAEQINMYEYITRALDTLNFQINTNKAIIKNNVKKDTILLANPAYMDSILMNLLTNAIKYKHPDRMPIIEINSSSEHNELILSVKDNGRGINLKKHGKDLFGMYKTFHGNADAQGIGLFITKYQVESMGGQIKIESQENKGTTFSLHFKQPSSSSEQHNN